MRNYRRLSAYEAKTSNALQKSDDGLQLLGVPGGASFLSQSSKQSNTRIMTSGAKKLMPQSSVAGCNLTYS